MVEKDQEETSFITPFGAFCYTSMPFGQNIVGATYQRCVQNFLEKHIVRNVHDYVDDIIVKSQKSDSSIADLQEMFSNLHTYQMKLNQTKCAFGIPSRKLWIHHLLKRN